MEGQKIKDVMRQKKMTNAELARRLGVSPQTLSAALQVEDVKTGLLERIAAILGEPVTYFYTGESSGTAVVNGGTVNGNVNGKVDEGNDAVAALVDQLAIKDRQIDRLLGLLEKSSRLRLATGPAGENMES